MEFGGLEGVKDDCRDARGLRVFDAIGRDTRYAVRLLRRSPGFTATALATLAICIGANLTIFAVVDALLLRPLPFPDADRLMSVYNTYPKAGVPNDGASLTNYYDRRGKIAAFEGVSAYRTGTAVIGESGATEQVPTMWVSADYFATLGVTPVMGRPFTEAEMEYGATHVAIVTDSFWRQRLGGDQGALGRTIRVGGAPTTVVGILPPDFRFLSSKTRVYFPLASSPEERSQRQRHSGNSHMVARLRAGVPVAQAQAEIDAHNEMLEAGNPEGKAMADAGFRSIVVPLRADHVAAVRSIVLLVQAGALVLLLIGLVNLINLLLIRASAREKERAVRQAIGAGRLHIIAEVVVETTVLAMLGGALGLIVGGAGVRLLGTLGAEQLPLGAAIAFDARVMLVALGAAAVMGIAMGVPVAWYCLRDRSSHSLHLESRSSTTHRAAARLRHAFIVAQIALAFVLLSGAGLLGVSLKNAMSMPAGFRPEQVLSGRISASRIAFPDAAALLAFTDRLSAELTRQPGVRAAGIATNVPLSGRSNKSAVTVKGYVRRPGESPQGSYSYGVDGDFFTAIGATLVEGRYLTAADSRRPERAVVVDESFARRYWPAGHALGQRLFMGPGRGARHRRLPDRRRDTADEAGRPDGRSDPGCGVFSVRPPHGRRVLRGGAHEPAAGVARDNAAGHRAAAEPRAAGQRYRDDGDASHRQPGRASLAGAAGRHVLGRRAAALRDWHLWGAELRRHPAAPGDWPAHGARRAPRTGARPVPGRGVASARLGRCAWPSRRLALEPRAPGGPLPRSRLARGNARGDSGRHCRDVHRRVRHPVASRRANLADGRDGGGLDVVPASLLIIGLVPCLVPVRCAAHVDLVTVIRTG